MSVIILIIILGVLIFVHELGHFLVAKKSGIRVDEFAIGFPPRIWSKVKNGTKYTLGLIPFGGYVKIFGETADEETLDPNNTQSFINKSRMTQAAVLVAGVLFNIIFAWILISATLMLGSPVIVTESNRHEVADSFISVTNVFESSPAATAGITPGDQILKIVYGENIILHSEITIAKIQEIISAHEDGPVTITLSRAGEERQVTVNAERGIVDENSLAIGISMERIGRLKLPFFQAIGRGYLLTGQLLRDITIGLGTFIGQAVTGNASLNQVAGPVGIVQLVGHASNFGFYYLLSFTAFISINLAILNILPFPALDGGRLVVVLIESIIRRQVNPVVINTINGIGFILLILLMIVITINDVLRLF